MISCSTSTSDEENIDNTVNSVNKVFNSLGVSSGLDSNALITSTKQGLEIREDADANLQLRVVSPSSGSPVKPILSIEYEEIKESSYSEVMLRSVICGMEGCYGHHMFSDPNIKDIKNSNNYCPLEDGPFTVRRIRKGETSFLDIEAKPSQDDPDVEEFTFVFPSSSTEKKDKLILHPPSELWGYDGSRLVVGVVASCHMQPSVYYLWYKDGEVYKEGSTLCCVPIVETGKYSVQVQHGDIVERSDPITVATISDVKSSSESIAPQSYAGSDARNIPVIEKDEISFSSKDEIGRGQFGIVYKGTWAGTPVAVKNIKVRNAKRLSSSVKNEVAVHSYVRHPNIVQIKGISFLKNSIYIISELIDGKNLEELIFCEEDGEESFTIHCCNKGNIAQQIAQAVAYMHHLRPQVIHRDIKPANVLVAKITHVTKLCDMGVSKLKSTQSLTQTSATSVPGTPHYMAPECLVGIKKATASSDVWSLACLLVELFTEADLWAAQLDEQTEVTALMEIMSKGEAPSGLKDLEDNSLHPILSKCFNYRESERPSALEILSILSALLK